MALGPMVSGCASLNRPTAIPYRVEVTADKAVNPDTRKRPSPIVVKFYELRGDGAFTSADFFSLQGKPEAALGQDFIAVEQLTLQPGETRNLDRPGGLDIRVLGIVAEYRALESSRWRQTVPMPQPKQLNPIKFWQFSPSRQVLRVAVRNGGIDLIPSDD